MVPNFVGHYQFQKIYVNLSVKKTKNSCKIFFNNKSVKKISG